MTAAGGDAPVDGAAPSDGEASPGQGPLGRLLGRPVVLAHVLAAAAVVLALVRTAPGKVAADTRQLIYLDPAGFIGRARSLWDPAVHLGTVTHQNVGLIAPMGAWFWAADGLGVPVWVAQRLWVAAIIVAAGAGVAHLARTLAWRGPGPLVAAAAYALSPYLLQYATRTSVLLLPFAGLPWMLSFAIRAVRSGSWRHPALLALVALAVGSVNATALILVGLGPALWLPYAVLAGEATARRALAVAARVGVLVAGVSAWWVVALAVQARHGIPVLTYTETIDDVAITASAPEVLRGLGYWVFYGREVLDPNVGAAVAYTQNPALLGLSYLVPGLGLVAAVATRWRHRSFFVGLVALGTIVAVGAHPVADASPAGRLFRDAADTTAGLALRSSTRAVPLVVLGLAMCLGHGASALAERWPRRRPVVAGAALAAVVATLPALLTGGFVDGRFARPDPVPDHWRDAARWLDTSDDRGRVLELPGIQFATYRWGTTYEPVLPGLVDRAVVAREQLPYGSAPSADLLIALDRRLQEGVADPAGLAPIAQLMGADHVLVRNDLAYERYLSTPPRTLARLLTPDPPGTRRVAAFGEGFANRPDPRLPLLDERALAVPDDLAHPPAIEVLEVTGGRPALRLLPARDPLVVVGDGEGLVDLAEAGLLDPEAAILYGTTLLESPEVLDAAVEAGARVVLTDTDRKRVRRWRSVRWSTGYTERADERSLSTQLGDAGLDVFPDAPAGSRTTTVQRGATVDASAYGGPFTLDPEVRPAAAVDGDPSTAWVVGPIVDPVGHRLVVTLDDASATDHLQLLQRQAPVRTQRIDAVEVRVEGGAPRRVVLDARSDEPPGQPIELDHDGSFRTVEITIAATSTSPEAAVRGVSPVGIAELSIDGVLVDEVVRPPSAALEQILAVRSDIPVTVVLTRLRGDPAQPVRGDEEPALARLVTLPEGRRFVLGGSARLSAAVPGPLVDELLGATGPVVRASSSLPGDLRSRPSAALDGDRTTRWRPAFLDLVGAWVEVELPVPTTVDRLDLAVVADGRHSVPTRVRVSIDGQEQTVDLPTVDDGDPQGHVVDLSVPLDPSTGRTVRVTVDEVRAVRTTDYFSRLPIDLPVGIAGLGVPGADPVRTGDAVDSGCRTDLLEVDGRAVAVRVAGSLDDALDRRPLPITACDGPLDLGPGDTDLRARPGSATGLDLDRLVLSDPAAAPPQDAGDTALVALDISSRTRYLVDLPGDADGLADDAWLVLGQSHDSGWQARLDGVDLGPPSLVDGFGNGWLLPAGSAGAVEVRWAPQRIVDAAQVASSLAALACVVLALAAGRRHRRSWHPTIEHRVRCAELGLRPGRLDVPVSTPGAVAGLTAAVALAAGLVVTPVAALPAGALCWAALTWRGGRLGLAAAVVSGWALASGWLVASQVLRPRRPDFEWIQGSLWPHRIALLAVVLLAASALIDALLDAPVRRSVRAATRTPSPSRSP